MRTSFLQKLLLLGTCLALSLLASEGALRLFLPNATDRVSDDSMWPWVVRDPILGWHNQPDFRHRDFSINSTGFRGPDVLSEPPRLRIVCIGDSRTFGIWLDEGRFRFDNDYPSRLEELLRERDAGASVEVINAGVIGYTSSHGLSQYVTDILALEPDVVVVGFGFNDHSVAYDPGRRGEEPRNRLVRRLHYALSHAQLYRLFAATRQSLHFLHPEPSSVPWVTPERYAENIRRFGEVSRERGVRLLLLAQGLRDLAKGPSRPAFPVREATAYVLFGAQDLSGLHQLEGSYLDVLRRTALREGIPLLDIAEVFERGPVPEVFGPYDLVHFNAAGADLIAEKVRERIRELGWLDPAAER